MVDTLLCYSNTPFRAEGLISSADGKSYSLLKSVLAQMHAFELRTKMSQPPHPY